jgi:hypothetical protein
MEKIRSREAGEDSGGDGEVGGQAGG